MTLTRFRGGPTFHALRAKTQPTLAVVLAALALPAAASADYMGGAIHVDTPFGEPLANPLTASVAAADPGAVYDTTLTAQVLVGWQADRHAGSRPDARDQHGFGGPHPGARDADRAGACGRPRSRACA